MNFYDQVKDILNPLPDPDKTFMKYWCQLYCFVSGSQIKLIVFMIIDEFHHSRELGLFLNPKELDTEINFWLDTINKLKGIDSILKNLNASMAKEIFANFRKDSLSKEIEFYENLLKDSKTLPQDAYISHLERVENTIVKAIFDKKFVYAHPKPPS